MNICDNNLDDCPLLNNENIEELKLQDFYQLRDRCKSGKNCLALDNLIYELEIIYQLENEGEE